MFACGNAKDAPPSTVEATSPADGSPDGTTSDEHVLPGPAASNEGNVVTYAATSLGLAAFSANGRVQPHGAPGEYYFEYGLTTAYGSKTPVKALGPRLAAFYGESWDKGLAGWRGGDGQDLAYHASGGLSGGYVRYGEPTGDDFNHIDGIGILHLVQYFYPGSFSEDAPTAALGGTDPDFRDARVRVAVRGVSFKPNGVELVWWSQVDILHGRTPAGQEPQYSNWAHTGFTLTDALFSGNWENVEYHLWNDTTDWTYAGSNAELSAQLGRQVYAYTPLDDVLGDLDTDFFHVLTYITNTKYPTGSIDFDNLEVTYRNHSLVLPSNGGKLVSAPEGSDDPATLTDGWRSGAGKTWAGSLSPVAPQEIVYDFEQPVVIDKVQLHQNPDWPSKDVEVLASPDGTNWTTIVHDTLADVGVNGPNFAYLLKTDLATPARKVKVRIVSGYRAQHWGLGEIEIFGVGGVMRTDDDWYRLNADITGLQAGQTYHYRLVAAQGGKLELGGDLTYTVPTADAKPEVHTGPATRIANGTAKVEGRMNSLGKEVQWYFEYGADTSYGKTTMQKRTGGEITPRTFVGALDGLTPGKAVHYRLVVAGGSGTSYGKDATFVAQ